ncbi:MAG: ATP-binding cassette domain-containing protein, partial [Gammaproteobacteria bacterium]|nr:ATP-binding cassette domain-containing protein [Gammaproteobacteria bacterium]
MGHIKIKGLTKSYINKRKIKRDVNDADKQGAEVKVFENLNLEFEDGEMVCILGPSGCGKSTLLRIMAGLDKEIEGEAIPMKGINIGYLAQEPQLNPEKDVRGNVEEGLGE